MAGRKGANQVGHHIREKIKAWVNAHDSWPTDLGRRAGLPANRACEAINGQRRLHSIDFLFPLARAMSVPLDWLVDDSKPVWPPPEVPPPGLLTVTQVAILETARIVGEELALRRLMSTPLVDATVAPGSRAGDGPQASPTAGEPGPRPSTPGDPPDGPPEAPPFVD